MIISKRILFCVTALLILICFFVNNYTAHYKEDLFVIREGETLKTISQNLKEEGFIRNSRLFYILLYFHNDPKDIKAGIYKLNSSMGSSEIINQIINGNTVKEKIVIREGWTINDIANYLEEKNLFNKEYFFNIAGKSELGYPSLDLSNEFEFLKYKPKNLSLEGFLFPDTYYINQNDTPEIIIKKMLSNFEKKVWNKIDNKQNFYDVLILSSLIEKEVRGFEDKQMISHVILKRLESNMPLQIDATVLYANKGAVFDSKVDSPFNTYKYTGLPIGPISNPGKESIEAALNPISNNYWYYLSAKDGTTIFSENFEEHKINKNIYLR